MPKHASVNCSAVDVSVLDLKPVPTSLQVLVVRVIRTEGITSSA